MPSSSHASSNSLLPTIAYQNWWPNSWTVTSSTIRILSKGQALQQPRRPGGDERRVLHAARTARARRRIHDREGLVGVPPVPQAVVLQPGLRRVDVTLRLGPVVRLQKHRDLDVGELHLVERAAEQLRDALVLGRRDVLRGRKRRLDDDVVRVRRPGEVVDVGLLVSVGRRPVAVRALAGAHPGRADDVAAGRRDLDRVAAVVGVELGGGVELVAVPTARLAAAHAGGLVDAELREPLAHEIEIVLVARPRKHLRQLRREGDLQRDRPAGRHGLGKRDLRDRLVICIPVIGLNEDEAGLEVSAGRGLHRGDVDPTPGILAHLIAAQLAAGLLARTWTSCS